MRKSGWKDAETAMGLACKKPGEWPGFLWSMVKSSVTSLGAQVVRSDVSELPPPSLRRTLRIHIAIRGAFAETQRKYMGSYLKIHQTLHSYYTSLPTLWLRNH
jgi:hypothetical protein